MNPYLFAMMSAFAENRQRICKPCGRVLSSNAIRSGNCGKCGARIPATKSPAVLADNAQIVFTAWIVIVLMFTFIVGLIAWSVAD